MGNRWFYVNAIASVLQLVLLVDYGRLVVGQRNQNENTPIGAHRRLPKTHFQCGQRPPGYYADVETGCQVYHMCDGLGRQFSYSCPNTTLFQQRMLICDHWYMVNCSKAESNYGANLLIGQRDKPFVREDEHELRTPRPDLLDRPYAPDYSGESFRNQYKVITPISSNSISDFDQQSVSAAYRKPSTSDENVKTFQNPYVLPAHWSTLHPQKQRVEQSTHRSNFEQFNQFEKVMFSSSNNNNDLKASSSQDSRRSQNEANFENAKSEPKPLAIEYQPPFLHPIFNENYTAEGSSVSSNVANNQFATASTLAPHETELNANSIDFGQINNNFVDETKIATKNEERILLRPSVVASTTTTTTTTAKSVLASNFGDRIPIENSLPKPNNFAPILNDIDKYPEPPTGLLPPFETLNLYSDATTQGPAIYYEWKIPASGLEPPHDEHKSNGVITINDNNQIPVIPPDSSASRQPSITIPILEKELVPPIFDASLSSNLINHIKLPAIALQPPPILSSSHSLVNDTAAAASNHTFPSIAAINAAIPNFLNDNVHRIDSKSQTPRSVATTNNNQNALTSKRQSETTTKEDLNYLDLKKQFSIPEYTFPLETLQRPGYAPDNAVNSFQIKIPDVVVNSDRDNSSGKEQRKKPWYGENAKCPECHPSFLKPGSCEPCIKIR